MLEEVYLLSQNKPITKEFIEDSYKANVKRAVPFLLQFLYAKDAKSGLNIIKDLVDQGLDIKYFTTNLLTAVHLMLLGKMEVEDSLDPMLKNLTEMFCLIELKNLTELFTRVSFEMKTAVLPQLPLELAVIEWCEQESESKKQEVIRLPAGQGSEKISSSSVVQEDEEVSVASLRKQVGNMKKIKALYGDKAVKSTVSEEEVVVSTTTVELMHTSGDGTVTNEWMEHFWRSLIDEMKKYNHTVAGVLRGCKIKSYSDQKLVIQTSYKFHKERLDDMKNHEALMNISKMLTGKDVAVEIELKGKI